ncbi:MAG: DMT family transporter [Deltaproteobacteria bacterium]|jgi:drug/metabolite transporter (DMT)-like permease|nr:DMT family transporter [Deltaproteobacteria bacterium]
MTKGKAVVYLLATAVLWSSAGVLIKSVGWNPVAITSARGLVAAVTLWILLPGGMRPREIASGHWVSAWALALLSVCFTASTVMTTAACAITLLFSAPVWVAFLAPMFLKERTAPSDWAFVAAIFGGMLLFFAGGLSVRSLAGAGLGACSGLFFAIQAVSLRTVKDRSPGTSLILGNLLAFAMGAPFWRPPWPDLGGIAAILVMGAFQVGLSYYLYAISIPFVTSLELVMITMIEPVLNGLLAFLVISEVPGPHALVGGVIVVGGVGAWSFLKGRRTPAPPG